MRIAFLTPEYPRSGRPDGGLANYLAKICPLLQRRDHEPVVFLAGERRSSEKIGGVQVIEVPCRPPLAAFLRGPARSARGALSTWYAARQIASCFTEQQRLKPFDIVQSASFCSLGLCLAGRSTVPLVVRVSSITSLWRQASEREANYWDRLFDKWEIEQMKRADAVFGPSRLLADILQKTQGISVNVIRTPFTLPAGDEDPVVYESSLKGKSYLLYFGTLNRIKGVDVLARAIPRVLSSNPKVYAVFVGRNENLSSGLSAEDFIRRETEKYWNRVLLLGRLPRSKLMPIVRNARVIVFPSRIDNYPNVCLEAQSMGRIVVATCNASFEEMVQDKITGFLVDQESTESLAAGINRVLALPQKDRKKMEESIFALSKTRNVDEAVNTLISFYTEAISTFKEKVPPHR